MKTIIISLLGLSSCVSGFVSQPRPIIPKVVLFSTEEARATEVPLVVSGTNIELTPALVDYVNKRIGGNLNKLGSNGAIRECDVHLSVNKNPKVKNAHKVEVTTNLKGVTIHSRTETPDMYESIDAVAHALNRKLRKYKERRQQGWHGGSNMGDDIMAILEEMEAEQNWDETAGVDDDEFEDPDKPTVMSVKSYDLNKPTSLEEAVFALDYTDHDFYVFRNKDTDAVNVVYKRNAGGIGHVEP
ncbi:hibernation promotion factor [Seminavis robusta]|uniref:Hibernation promotion factor n=1 Tax=Seminavis robusta TaxID=568900 RepID=A0A9N8HLX9_9STRA|nr:hibernation promotion factor [Seminavis robusta]|eukprot:Sro861_g212350.1 hibernation promotion factor (243) ;mRNA; r:41422-42427